MYLYSLCAAAILITGFIDNTALFCSARDLVDATKKGSETVFCTISGRNDYIVMHILHLLGHSNQS